MPEPAILEVPLAAAPTAPLSAARADTYVIPAAYRQMENTHILFWLVKDISWCLVWRPLGILMILPTLGIALVIMWRTRALASELAHNAAIVCWIAANSYWMLSEFMHFDTAPMPVFGDGKHLAIIPFSVGLLILGWYYLVVRRRVQGVR